jgi:hypothetical protein
VLTLEEFASGVWIADGSPVSVVGPFKLPTRMIVVELADGSLWLNSPLEATRAEMESIARLGPVRYLVAPTPLHAWRLPAWKAVFSEAQTWGSPGTSRAMSFDRILGDAPPSAWMRDLDQLCFRGNLFVEEFEFLHRNSRTLIMTDFIQIYSREQNRAWRNALMRLTGVLEGGVPMDIRFSFVRRSAARRSFRKLLSWDFERLIVAHGQCVDADAKPFVEKAFRWLGSPRRPAKGCA